MQETKNPLELIEVWKDHHDEYLALRKECKDLELDIEEEKLKIMTAEENKSLKVTEKRDIANKSVLSMQRELIALDYTKSVAYAMAEKYERVLQFLLFRGDEE